jgi:hypothetical protein
MRITVPLVIEMSDEQVKMYANEYALDDTRAKTVVDDVRKAVLHGIQGLFDGFADVTIKR